MFPRFLIINGRKMNLASASDDAPPQLTDVYSQITASSTSWLTDWWELWGHAAAAEIVQCGDTSPFLGLCCKSPKSKNTKQCLKRRSGIVWKLQQAHSQALSLSLTTEQGKYLNVGTANNPNYSPQHKRRALCICLTDTEAAAAARAVFHQTLSALLLLPAS